MVDLLEVDLAENLGQKTFEVDELRRIKTSVYASDFDRPALRKKAFESVERWEETQDKQLARAAGMAFWLLNEVDRAIELLETATASTDVKFCLAELLVRRGDYARAAKLAREVFEATEGSLGAGLVLLEALRGMVDSTGADDIVAELVEKYSDSPDVRVEQGLLLEQAGDYDGAVAVYTRVLDAHPGHGRALFRLAYNADLRGDEETAVSLYQQVMKQEPAYINAMINLGILYDDVEDYDAAADCFDKVLRVDPNHPRAQLFYKDAVAAKTMYYDEELEKRQDKRNRVLEIPVTDFELSVRSRNCLERMNIQTLGDLTRVTEQDLLNFKNFGETSLNEIRQMLASQGLRLGQAVEEEQQVRAVHGPPVPPSRKVKTDVVDQALSEFSLPIRIRRCAEVLGVHTLGELAQKTEEELLKVKNFGQTSLVELKEFLAQYGLALREAE